MTLSLLNAVFPKGVIAVIVLFTVFASAMFVASIYDARKRRLSSLYSSGILVKRGIKFVLVVTALIVVLNQLIDLAQFILSRYSTVAQRGSILVGGLALAVGLMAYLFKLQRQPWYGLAEIIVGTMVAVDSLSGGKANQAPSITGLLPLFGAIYVIVRGLTNVVEGFLGKVSTLSELAEELMKKTEPQISASISSSPQSPR